MRLFDAIVKPTVLYSSETCTLQKSHMKKVQATGMRYMTTAEGGMRYMTTAEGVTRMDRVRRDEIRERLRQKMC